VFDFLMFDVNFCARIHEWTVVFMLGKNGEDDFIIFYWGTWGSCDQEIKDKE
jgi:hypothetical protein